MAATARPQIYEGTRIPPTPTLLEVPSAVRDSAELARLPPRERAAWQALWADVAALLERAGGGR